MHFLHHFHLNQQYKITNSYVRSSLDPPLEKKIFSYGKNVCKIEKIEIFVVNKKEYIIVNKVER